MKIAVYHNLPSGGGKRALYEMTRRLSARHTVDVYTLSCAEHDFCDIRPFAHLHIAVPFATLPLARRPFGRLNQGIRALDLWRVRTVQRQVAQKIDGAGYDVVFAHNCRYGQAPSVLEFLRTPTVYYCAEPPRLLYEPRIPRPYNTFTRAQRMGNWIDPLPRGYRSTLRRYDRQSTIAATTVLTNSAYSRESLYRIYGIFARISYLGVDVDRFQPQALPKGKFVVSVGALNPHKGFDFVIRSMALLDEAQRPRLILIGNAADWRERAYLQSLAQQLRVMIDFKTLVTDEELIRLYCQAQLTLYAPVMEPFGFVPLESMACGTAVVGVREAGVRESVIDGETGVLVDREPAAMAAAVQALLCNPAAADRLGRNGRLSAEEKWTWDKSVEAIERHLADTAKSKYLTGRTSG